MNRVLVAMTAWAGCTDDGPATALRIELVPNAALNSRQEVRDALDTLEVVVDGTIRPLRGLPGEPGPVGDRANAENRDRDDDLELVFTVDLARYEDLPLVQIEPGHNGDQALLFRMCGLDGSGETAATGQVVVAFQPGEIVRAQTPFNLRAEYRVPRVIAVQPDPDRTDVACDGSFAVIFSEAMDPISASAEFAFRTPTAIVDGAIAMEDGSTRLEFAPAQPLAPGAYSLEVGTGALDEHGESLDQDPYTAGAQPFVLRFTVTCR